MTATKTHRPAGPIAQKILRTLDKVKHSKVVDLAAWRAGQEQAAEILAGAKPSSEVAEASPAFAAYAFVNNWAMGLVEAMQGLDELGRFVDRIERAEEEYQPSGPPMSPLTRTFFWYWALYDLTVGVKKETLGHILLAVARHLRMDPQFLALLERLAESRMGFYVHEGKADGHVRLRELVTGVEHLCECTSGHEGRAGELWFVRLVPPPVTGWPLWTTVTTPYVITSSEGGAWRAYFDRTLPKSPDAARRHEAYARLMKSGPDGEHWHEYVFQAYAGHTEASIALRGLPDIAESRPHAELGVNRGTQRSAPQERAEPSKHDRPRPARKVSETLLDFATPLTEAIDDTTPLETVQKMLQLAATVWNAVVFAHHGDADHLVDLRRRAPGGPPGFPAVMAFLIRRKQTEFVHDDWLVGDVSVKAGRGPEESFHVVVEARVPKDASPSATS